MRVLIRLGVLLMVFATGLWTAYAAAEPRGDVAIGAGLAFLAVLVLVAVVWGGLDGRNHTVRPVAVTWVPAGALFGACVPVINGVVEGLGPTGLLAEVPGAAVFFAALIGVPAVIAGSVVNARSWKRTPPA